MIEVNQFQNFLENKLRNETREREILAKFINQPNEQGLIVDVVTVPMIDKDSPRRKLYKIMHDMYSEQKNVNALSVKAKIREEAKKLERETMMSEFNEIMETDSYDSVENISESLHIAFQNRVIFYDIIEKAQNGFMSDISPRDLIDQINKSLAEAEPPVSEKSFAQMVKETRERIINPKESEKGLSTGLSCLDNTFGGILEDRYWTIGAESGTGKTSFLINMVFRLCMRHPEKIAICFFSMEMSESRIIERLVSTIVSMTSFKMNGRAELLTEDEIEIIEKAFALIETWPITLLYKSQTPESIKRTFRRFAIDNRGKHLIGMFDHIGLIEGKGDIREVTIAASKACKSLCRNHKATVFVLVQLKKELSDTNNKANKDSFHRPNLSHIMESGSIRADSDVVILLWRPETRFTDILYNNMNWPTHKRAIFINEKNRDGQCPCDLIVRCEIQYNQFYDLENPFDLTSKDYTEVEKEPEKTLWDYDPSQPLPF